MRILAITSNPKKRGALATLTDAASEAARTAGAEVEEVRLADLDLRFCRFCMTCWKDVEARVSRCVQDDDMAELLSGIDESDGFILSSPTSSGHESALMKTFEERCTWTLARPTKRYAWVTGCPASRIADKQRHAVLLTTAGTVPAHSKRLCYGAISEMRELAHDIFNARIVGTVFAGMINRRGLDDRDAERARELGMALAHAGERHGES
jgi:multimeric flavodoxin WrbA